MSTFLTGEFVNLCEIEHSVRLLHSLLNDHMEKNNTVN